MREELQKQLEHRYGVDGGIAPEVWGHSTAHHTTGNVNLVGFQGGAVSSTGMALLTVLGRRMAQLVMETMGLDSLTNAQSDKIYDMSRSAIKRVLTPRTGRLDATNTYFREIPQLGIDRVWQDVSTPYSPDFSNLNLTEGATLRMARGAEEYQQRFLNEVEKLKQHVIRVTAQRR